MSQYDDFYTAIHDIKGMLSRDLIGPITPTETIENVDPLSYYVMGILWAKRQNMATEPEQEDAAMELVLATELADELEDESEHSDNIANTHIYKPSAMGVSVMLPPEANKLDVIFSFAKYTYSERQEYQNDDEEKQRKVRQYTRTPRSLEMSSEIPEVSGSVICDEQKEFHKLGVDLTLTVRRVQNDGSKLVTVSVANALYVPQKKREQNESALFQVKLTLSNPQGFIPIYQAPLIGNSDDEKITSMLYSNILNYAYGHGCSTQYEEDNEGKVTAISSDFMPTAEVLQMRPGDIATADILRLGYWATAEHTAACAGLLGFVSEYANWLESQTLEAASLAVSGSPAHLVTKRIAICITRIRNGIAALQDDIVWQAFLLMNEAMLLQRQKAKKLPESQLDSVTWYPFQLAYILQIIPDIINTDSEYRDSVDLLWFPTGGGKTEAYLGVASFAIFYRRLSLRPNNDGVTVIMRYTLRLLTIQQFERASALICASEYLRRQRDIPGGEISIGLWIGSGMTPNHIEGEEGAAKVLGRLRQNPEERINEGNPVQITSCPWCGEPIDLDGYHIIERQLVISCHNNPHCEFHKALPIYVVDDDVYAKKPTLLLSTIDKFARLAWEPKSKSIFGEDGAPPELIIQDELHLISGPLGTLAGIYEIAVEYLSTRQGRYPKIIASTATVKNAVEQIRNLYNKDTIQFPPSGLSFVDSFFAVRANKDDRPARTYIGLCEAGGSLADLILRVYANLLFVKLLFIKQGRDPSVIDQFATIIGYFNALKDLGVTDNIIRDRVYVNVCTLIERKFRAECDVVGLTKEGIRLGHQDELTSRKSSKEIKETLARLETAYPNDAHYSLVFASNMLSVGIDINRLGLMTVYNQPKSNAEYIQATSRVGRQNPGLIITMFNAARSRDKSHYEQFNYYHQAFYQYVEATSVTPFSVCAIEKALHCVLVAMLRLTVNTLEANIDAVNFRQGDAATVIDYILARIKAIQPDSYSFAGDYLSDVAEKWEYLAHENPDTLVYADHKGNKVSLLQSAERDMLVDFPPVLNSLRNVEPSANVFIERR
jgi:hypothetical protein